MIKDYYAEDFKFDEKNVKTSILVPPEKRPTFNQFRYWYEAENSDLEKNVTSRKGAKKYALENRAILGTSTQETIGPGSRYQIDATIADVYLVSKYQRNWIIGRPIVYVIIDVFSRMIVGVYVGLEGPSWLGAMMALANAASNKVPFCQKFGINIDEEQWACHHLPDCILGDRGELAGMTVETMIPNLFITERLEQALLNPEYMNRWGVLFLGESDDLVNVVKLVSNDFGMKSRRWLIQDNYGEITLPYWVEPFDFKGTRWLRYRLQSISSQLPPELAWTTIQN